EMLFCSGPRQLGQSIGSILTAPTLSVLVLSAAGVSAALASATKPSRPQAPQTAKKIIRFMQDSFGRESRKWGRRQVGGSPFTINSGYKASKSFARLMAAQSRVFQPFPKHHQPVPRAVIVGNRAHDLKSAAGIEGPRAVVERRRRSLGQQPAGA